MASKPKSHAAPYYWPPTAANRPFAKSSMARPDTIAYTAYGEQSALNRRLRRDLGFNGQVREMTTHWYLLGNGYRAYNPRLMRFHSPDSWSPFGGGGLNAYMYCEGEPVNHSDPTGHSKLGSLFGFFFGGPNYTGSGGLALNFGPMTPNGKGEGAALMALGGQMAKGNGIKRPPSVKEPSPSRNNNGSDGISIGGHGNPGIALLAFGKRHVKNPGLLHSNSSFSTGGPTVSRKNSLPTYSEATANTKHSKMPLWNNDT
jgi:RHS repeat-associated protein